jgi:hypothetical protein
VWLWFVKKFWGVEKERERKMSMGGRSRVQGHTSMCACSFVRRVKNAGPVAVQIRFRSPTHVVLGMVFEDRVLRLSV